LSPSSLPQHTLTLKINNIVILLIFQLLKSTAGKISNKVACNVPIDKAQGHTLKRDGLYLLSPLFIPMVSQLYVTIAPESSFDSVGVSVIENYRLHI
jgi:hypothetical protein